jgi:hypothetical protein
MFIDYHDLIVTFGWRSKRRSKWLEKRALINIMRERGTFCARHGLVFRSTDSEQHQSSDVEFPIQIPVGTSNQSLHEELDIFKAPSRAEDDQISSHEYDKTDDVELGNDTHAKNGDNE